MPEGHLYHRRARDLNKFTGRALAACSPQGPFDEGAAQINGTRLEVAEAHGKHLLVRLAGGRTVHVHLGMRGKLLSVADLSRPPLPQVRLRLAGVDAAWDLDCTGHLRAARRYRGGRAAGPPRARPAARGCRP